MINNIGQRENTFRDLPSLKHSYDQVTAELHNVVHDNLDALHQLNRKLQEKIEHCRSFTALAADEGSLDAELQAKLNPSTSPLNHNENAHTYSFSSPSNTNHQRLTNTDSQPLTSASASQRSDPVSSTPTYQNHERVSFPPTYQNHEPVSAPTSQRPEPVVATPEPPQPVPVEKEPTADSMNSASTADASNDGANHDEFDAGYTRRIQRTNPIIIPTRNDKFAATVCSHNNELLFNNYDQLLQEARLMLIPDINNPTYKKVIPWNQRVIPINDNDDEWIQDMIYSDKLGCYLLLNRSRLFTLVEQHRGDPQLDNFHEFADRNMKRLAANDKFIFVTASASTVPVNGDEIILVTYDKQEQLRKTFRDIIPGRVGRGAGPLVGEISDIATGADEQVIIGYRLDRRKEIGVCLYNVTNDGRMWSSVKQLLLNECWHDDLSYTPRLDWSDQLKNFILIEYMTGHLIMIDRHGQVDGECRFMQAENRRESPINLAISNSGYLCVRYDTSITIHKLA